MGLDELDQWSDDFDPHILSFEQKPQIVGVGGEHHHRLRQPGGGGGHDGVHRQVAQLSLTGNGPT